MSTEQLLWVACTVTCSGSRSGPAAGAEGVGPGGIVASSGEAEGSSARAGAWVRAGTGELALAVKPGWLQPRWPAGAPAGNAGFPPACQR